MSTVKQCLGQKSNVIISVEPADPVVKALELMRSNRVRSILVIEADTLKGIVTQGDCAIKVLLPGQDARAVRVGDIMTKNPICVRLKDDLDQCMGLMASRNIRHLPVLEEGKVVGVVSIGDIVKDIIRMQGDHIKQLETYIKGHGVE